MIMLGMILSALFLILSYYSYTFVKDTIACPDATPAEEEHQLVHLIFGSLFFISSVALTILYATCTVIPVLFPASVMLITTLLFMKSVFQILFCIGCLIVIRHVSCEANPKLHICED